MYATIFSFLHFFKITLLFSTFYIFCSNHTTIFICLLFFWNYTTSFNFLIFIKLQNYFLLLQFMLIFSVFYTFFKLRYYFQLFIFFVQITLLFSSVYFFSEITLLVSTFQFYREKTAFQKLAYTTLIGTLNFQNMRICSTKLLFKNFREQPPYTAGKLFRRKR